jgi:TolB-like protein/class 3 adenylate cyclase/Flp pilus assembly protein TadD
MAAEIKKEIQLEIAHVLFIDIVGYSKLLINEQRALLDMLNQIVRGTDQFRSAEAAGKLVKVPTGDGMALVFYSNPEAPVECALEISRVLKNRPELKLRMGVHSGPVSGVVDVNERANVAGAGINVAQRVMDCGDAGHILLSKHVAEDLEQYGHWQPHLHDLGGTEVKHGVRVHVVNLYTDDLGNPEPPEKFKSVPVAAAVSAAKEPRARTNIRRWTLVGAAIAIAVAIAGFYFFPHRPASKASTTLSAPPSAAPRISEKSIAVLPFENLSEDKANAYFAVGIQDEILTRLAKIGALKVISHNSTQQYAARPGNLPEIARQLGVANILEGSVQKAADQVHINVQLIRAATDEHLWAESYDRKLENIFGVEAEVATAVAEALKAKLTGVEHEVIEQKPTNNPDAYLLYLRAREREGGVDASVEDYIAATELYAQAIALDPTFALARARASIRNSRIFDANKDQARKSKARAQAEEALQLSPTLGEAHFALGLYLWLCERDFEPALKELSIAEKTSPNSAEILWYSAAIYRNQGRWHESLMTAERAQNLDPRNAQIALYAAYNHCMVRDWQGCTAGFNSLLQIAPNSVFARVYLACLEVIRNGDLAAAKAILRKIPAGINPQGEITDTSWDLSMLERDFASAEKILEGFPSDEKFPDADRPPKAFYQGCTALARGDTGLAQSFFEIARPSFEAKVRDHPDDAWRRADLGLLYAYLGRKEDAIRESRRAVELAPESKEPLRRTGLESNLALVYARTGEADQAITLIERLLSTPGAVDLRAPWSMTLADLRLRWEWDPLRADPRFQKILAGPEPKTIY